MRSFSRARASRLRSVPAGPSQPSGGLVEGEALEVAEHDRQAEGPRQAVDLAVQGLGLLAVDGRPVGRRGRRHGAARAGGPLIVTPPRLAPAADPLPRTPRRPDRDPVQPVAQQVGVADRPGLRARTRKTAWKASSACWRSPRSCRQTPSTIGPWRATSAAKAASPAGSSRPVAEPLQELAVGEPGRRAALEERTELPGSRTRCHTRHGRSPLGVEVVSWHRLPGREEKPTGKMPVPRTRRPLIPTQGTVTPPAGLSRGSRKLSSMGG